MTTPSSTTIPTFDSSLIRKLQLQSDIALKAKLLHTKIAFTNSLNTSDNLDEERRRKESVSSALSKLQSLVEAEQTKISKLTSQLNSLTTNSTSSALTSETRNIIHQNAVRTAHDDAYKTITYLPSHTSPLNTLLAYRSTIKTIDQTRQTIDHVRTRIAVTREDLQKERDALQVAKEIQVELEKRIRNLENDDDSDEEGRNDNGETRNQRQQRKEQLKLSEMTTSTKEYRKQSGTLIRQLAKFSKDRLALMITVEEMGGPVVGTELDMDKLEEMADVYRNDNNEKGQGKKGKGRKVKEKGQKRIDEIWGRRKKSDNPDADNDDEDRMDVDVTNPVDAAGNEILDLIETLLNQSLDQSSSVYTVLPRDSAIARFLVRSYVATLHPRDALRIRLIDFAATVEEGG